jgi:hypothetical protein
LPDVTSKRFDVIEGDHFPSLCSMLCVAISPVDHEFVLEIHDSVTGMACSNDDSNKKWMEVMINRVSCCRSIVASIGSVEHELNQGPTVHRIQL